MFLVVRRRHSGIAAFWIALMVIGQVLAWHHQAETTHITCPEHGEQIDAPEAARFEASDSRQRLVAVGDGAARHRDCAINRLLRSPTRTSQPAELHAVTTVAIGDAPIATASWARFTSVIDIAPKTSPPT